MKVVLIEQDYKGYYGRYALTLEEFNEEFEFYLGEGMSEPTDGGDSWTLSFCVHVWYQLAEVGGEMWETFFTDLEWGLPESDIEDGNIATVDDYRCKSLKPLVARYV